MQTRFGSGGAPVMEVSEGSGLTVMGTVENCGTVTATALMLDGCVEGRVTASLGC